jgi:hypothetical protein
MFAYMWSVRVDNVIGAKEIVDVKMSQPMYQHTMSYHTWGQGMYKVIVVDHGYDLCIIQDVSR